MVSMYVGGLLSGAGPQPYDPTKKEKVGIVAFWIGARTGRVRHGRVGFRDLRLFPKLRVSLKSPSNT